MSVDYRGLSTIHFYIILKRRTLCVVLWDRLSTIHFYIILKHTMTFSVLSSSLSTIHFYIILKLFSFINDKWIV